MEGRPVWLASVSLKRRSGTVATGTWDRSDLREAEDLIDRTLEGLGDTSREREFRMNITLCRHRAMTDTEIAAMPPEFRDGRAFDIAGSPVEVLWSKGVKEAVSTQPCANPGHRVHNLSRPDLWIPIDCGACEPCKARARAL